MRDLTKRGNAAGPPPLPRGLAFELSDLALARQWAESYHFSFIVRLDHGAAVCEDYEEVIAFQTGTSPLYRWIIWRNTAAVFVRPVVGRTKRYKCVVEALNSLLPRPRVTLTDLKATIWPQAQRPG